MIIYFSKINLESTELLEMYKKEEMLDSMKKSLLAYLASETEYELEKSYVREDGELKTIDTKYRISIGRKEANYVSGVIYKTSLLYYKKLNQSTNQVEPRSVETIEDVRFYFDVARELVGFHTRNRFGYREFNEAFAGIINKCMENNNSPLRFSAALFNEGMQIDEIERELKLINNIKKLIFTYKLPNPADGSMLEQLNTELTDTVEMLEKANAHTKSVIFESDGKIGLNVGSGEIKENIGRVGHLTKGITDKEAIQNGYACVKALAKDGKIYTTEDQKPIKREILDNSPEAFFKACRDTILNIFSGR